MSNIGGLCKIRGLGNLCLMVWSYNCELLVLLVLSEKIWYCLSEHFIKLGKNVPWNFSYVIDFKFVLICIWISWNVADIKGNIVNGDLFYHVSIEFPVFYKVISEYW